MSKAWLLALALMGSPALAAPDATEVWSATLVLPAELRDLQITFERAGTTWTASMQVKAKTLPLMEVKLDADHIMFALGNPKAPKEQWERYDLPRKSGAGEATGLATIGGAPYYIKMVRLKAGEAPHSVLHRPQTPVPPFSYTSRDVVIDAPDGGKLAGTLSIPAGAGPHPAVLLWSGSGQQDRDENIFGHKPFLVLADRLTRAGVAVLRLDDRATGKTVGPVGTLDTEIADATAAVAFLKTQPEVDPKRLGMFGHSTGGMVLANVAVKTKSLAFLVSLAGVAIPGWELVALQLEASGRIKHTPDAELKKGVEIQRKIGAAAVKGEAEVRAAFTELVTPVMAAQLGRAPTKEEVQQAIAPQVAEVMAPWTQSYFKIDPRVSWKQLELPTLLVVGDKDTQVPAGVTIKAIQGALSKRRLSLFTPKKLPGLNHLFQHAGTGLIDEYPAIEETFDPATLDLITAWVKKQAKL